MRKAAVRHGDPTTTRGFVMAYSSTFHDDGKKIALSGDEATCGNCKGAFKIYGTGKGISEKGRDAVLDGDPVLCPCGKNRVIVGDNPGVFLTTNEGSAVAKSAAGGFSIASTLASSARVADDDDNSEGIYPAPVADAKAKTDCSYLDGSKARIDAPADLYKHVNDVTVSPGKPTTFAFPGGGAGAATQYDATVNGRPVSIYVPAQTPAQGYGIPGQKEIAKALEAVPPQQYKDLDRVSLNALPNPRDALWQEEYGDSSFSSAATANIKQGVAFFPWKGWSTFPQRYIDSTMLHETGHLWSEALWSDPTKKQDWQDAMTSDAQAPSQYARNNMTEDFAESSNMYWSSKGTPCETEGRKRYRARYEYFDKIAQ
jgi:hypothetical protein